MRSWPAAFPRILFFFGLFLVGCTPACYGQVYVDQNSPGPTHDGTSWDQAFLMIQEGVDAAALPGNEVWVADPLMDAALLMSAAGIVSQVDGLDGPFDVATTSDGGCWIADRTSVLLVDESGEVQLVVGGFTGAADVAYNSRTGECWVADSLADKIVRVNSSGEWVIVLSGVTSPFALEGRWDKPD